MALLQIAEPGQSSAPHSHKVAVGIDLGTTHSLIGVVRHGVPEILADENGNASTPSVVYYQADGRVLVGHDAIARSLEDPRHTISSIKRLMGKKFSDLDQWDQFPYDLVDAPGMVKIQTPAGLKNPVEISADILRQLYQKAQARLGVEPVGAVITVPSYFDEAQRQATKDAATLAGIPVLRLLNEPTAAALAYGLDSQAQGRYVVYDLGGGTFDVSILQLKKGVFEVLSTHGDTHLGGDDFDHRIVCWFLETCQLQMPPLSESRLLWMAARSAREALTTEVQTTMAVTLGGVHHEVMLSRLAFQDMSRVLVQKTLVSLQYALADAKLSVNQIDGVILVGGATRMPMIRRAVEDFFGQVPLTDINPDEVVAVGAARQAHLLAGNRSEDDWLLLDVVPLSLGIETMGGLVERIIPRNTAIPIAKAQEFTTFKDGQTAMAIHVVQGERDNVHDCRSLGRFELRGIPPMVAGAAKIRVTFQVDADGLLSVSAKEMKTNVSASITVKPSFGLDDETILKMLSDGMAQAQSDRDFRQLREEQVEAERLIDATQTALQHDAHLLTQEQLQTIEHALSRLQFDWHNTTDHLVLRQSIERLSQATESFAMLRMNLHMQQALKGLAIQKFDQE